MPAVSYLLDYARSADTVRPGSVLTGGRSLAERRFAGQVLLFRDPAMRLVVDRLQALAMNARPVLLTGETGSGKQLLGRYLHALGPHPHLAFEVVTGGATGGAAFLPEARPGQARRQVGTLFLDGIEQLDQAGQARVLDLLRRYPAEEHAGAAVGHPRLVASSRTDLAAAVRSGRFREDLYYRLQVAALAVPPLRDRPGDILPLARHFLATFARQSGAAEPELSDPALDRLRRHHWPGNVQELQGVLRQALLRIERGPIEAGDLDLAPVLTPPPFHGDAADDLPDLDRFFHHLLERREPDLHGRVEEALLRAAFRYCQHNQVRTAQALGISRNTLRTALGRLGVISARRRDRSEPGSARRAQD